MQYSQIEAKWQKMVENTLKAYYTYSNKRTQHTKRREEYEEVQILLLVQRNDNRGLYQSQHRTRSIRKVS